MFGKNKGKWKSNSKLIAIDFDDTITNFAPYPHTGTLNKKAEKYIRLLVENGYTLILWTARTGENYKEACKLIEEWNLPIKLDDKSKYEHGTTGKISVDFFIDDRSFTGKINWRKLYKYILNNV